MFLLLERKFYHHLLFWLSKVHCKGLQRTNIMFYKMFSTKARKFFLKRSSSTQEVSLNRKIIIGHCKEHDTIILIILIEGFNLRKKIIFRLWKRWKILVLTFWLVDATLTMFFDESPDHTFSMYCLTDEFLVVTYEKSFWSCQCPEYSYDSKKKRCEWCLFYGDVFTFCHDFLFE